MEFSARTDLAAEARDLWRQRAGSLSALEGVAARREERDGFPVDYIEILSEAGERALGKPRGRYVTVTLLPPERREPDAFPRACRLLSAELRSLLRLREGESVLVAALGNEAITPDALGPLCAGQLLVTRHLKEQLPAEFRALRSVSVLRSGVLGTTGLESSELVEAAAAKARPDRIVAIDALCAADAEKLCRTVQLSDAGIVPGGGVGNARRPLNEETLGVPVLALGMPTVVAASRFGPGGGEELIVTPRDIDSRLREAARLIAWSLNFALHPGLTPEELELFLR